MSEEDDLGALASRLAREYPYGSDAGSLFGWIKLILWVMRATRVLK